MEPYLIELQQTHSLTSTPVGSLWDSQLAEEFESIPNKLAFKIGEVADFLGVKQYVLRFWETEFSVLRPEKSKTGQRVYCRKDVELAFLIRKLLHRDRFSIEGARAALRGASMKVLREEVRQCKASSLPSEEMNFVKESLSQLSSHIKNLQKLF